MKDHNNKSTHYYYSHNVSGVMGAVLVTICICSLIFERIVLTAVTSTTMMKNDLLNQEEEGGGGGYFFPNVIYGHIHMSKTGGTSLNGILATKFERVCGNKGFSYDAYGRNERAKVNPHPETIMKSHDGYDRLRKYHSKRIGFEDCDYISMEDTWTFWSKTFPNATFHGIPVELHIPCRDTIDHILSTCDRGRNKIIRCNYDTDQEFYKSIDKCRSKFLNRFHFNLLQIFTVKCFDFRKQFTTYVDTIMANKLQSRRIVSEPYVMRSTDMGSPRRNKTVECLWDHPDLMEKAKKHLLDDVSYYQFCNTCMGSENEITNNVY